MTAFITERCWYKILKACGVREQLECFESVSQCGRSVASVVSDSDLVNVGISLPHSIYDCVSPLLY